MNSEILNVNKSNDGLDSIKNLKLKTKLKVERTNKHILTVILKTNLKI